MPYKVSWYEPASVVYAQFVGQVTLEESTASNNLEIDLLEQAKTKSFFIVDVTQIERQEGNLTQIRDAVSVLKHPNLGCTIVVGSSNRFISFISTALLQFFHVKSHFCNTLPEAAQFIQTELNQNSEFGDALEAWLMAERI